MLWCQTACAHIPATSFMGFRACSVYVDSIFLICKVGIIVVPTLYNCMGIQCVSSTGSLR